MSIIEKNEKSTIREIFKKKGENYFRIIEKKKTLDLLKKSDLVIALGGGSFVNTTIRKIVKKTAMSFWLDLKLSVLLTRLKNVKKRPLLTHNNLEKTVNKIYSERKKFYSESDFRINCDLLDTNQIINRIIKLYENTGNKN